MRLMLCPALPVPLARLLQEALAPEGWQVLHFSDRFPPDTADQHWMLTLLAESEPTVLLSGNEIYLTNPAGQYLWRQIGLTGLLLPPGWKTPDPLVVAGKLLLLWPKVRDWLRDAAPPQALILPVTGHKLRVMTADGFTAH